MSRNRSLPRLCFGLLVAVVLATTISGAPPAPLVQAETLQTIQATTLPARTEIEPNNRPATATAIGPANPRQPLAWRQTISGAISQFDDRDWYRIEVVPASTITIELTNLPADYDLVLASGPDDLPAADDGLQKILDIGGSITAIGGSITAIGGSITAIGGSITAIGGSITAIGGSITAISVQRGNAAERIETFLWQPGAYYIAVVGNNGAFSPLPYQLQVEVSGSDLTAPARPAPAVDLSQIAPDPDITTLYVLNPSRMEQLYPTATRAISEVVNVISDLTANNGFILDLSTLEPADPGGETVGQVYARWDANRANPLEANRVARLVDNLITAATVRNPAGILPLNQATGPAPAPERLVLRESAGATPANTGEPPFPNVRSIVIVGGDDVIPFFRVPDLTTIANEADYAAYLREIDASGIIDPNTAQGAALRYRTIQTDNIYGADGVYRFLGLPLFIPDRAVGRLVETPDEISRYLAPYYGGGEPSITPVIDLETPAFDVQRRAFVTGYDFLIDQAEEISRTLRSIGFTEATSITGLIRNDWTAPDLANAWFDSDLDTRFSDGYYAVNSPFALQSVNAHFDHWQTIPATTTLGFFEAQRILAPTGSMPWGGGYFTNRLGYSVGCHSGFNVLARSLSTRLTNEQVHRYSADFAQAFLKQGGNWIGNTGYGYGALDTVGYSERLSVLFTEELARDVQVDNVYVGQDIGMALVRAKQRYIRTAASLGPYDAKVLMVNTLYGLPFVNVRLAEGARLPVPIEDRPDLPSDRIAPTPPPAESLGTLERVITFTLTFDEQQVDRTGSRYLEIDTITASDSFVPRSRTPANAQLSFSVAPEPRPLETTQAGRPVLPAFSYDISAWSVISNTERLIVRDVSFLSGDYGTDANYRPVITQIVTETDQLLTRTSDQPNFAAGAGIWFPDKFFTHSSVGNGDERRDQLIASAAQFRAATDGETGVMRPYTTMVFRVTYLDPASSRAEEALNDTRPPQIEGVFITASGAALQATSSRVVVQVTDQLGDDPGVGIANVSAVYVVGGDTWQPLTFTRVQVAGSVERWAADVPVAPADLRLIVRAQDRAGNAGFFTAKGSFAPPPPMLTYISVVRR